MCNKHDNCTLIKSRKQIAGSMADLGPRQEQCSSTATTMLPLSVGLRAAQPESPYSFSSSPA